MNRKRSLIFGCALTLVATSAAWSQPRPDKGFKDWFGHIAGGFTLTQGDVSDILDDGYSIRGGATYWPEEWPVGLVMELEYSGFDISNETIRNINDAIEQGGGEGMLTGGDVETWSFTLNGTWSPTQGQGFYLIGGVGAYRVEGRIKEDGLVYYPPICDPWFWWCTPGGVGPGTIVVASESTTEFGWNVGLGFAFEVGAVGSQFFIESRYHSANTSPEATTYLPLSIGFRW
jgi:opacity protein-like surface antigen